MKSTTHRWPLVLALAAFPAADALAQCTLTRVTAGFVEDELTFEVDADGDYVVISASGLDDVASNAGGAIVYWFNGYFWQWMAKLTTTPLSSSGDELGEAVAIDGPWLILTMTKDSVGSESSGTAVLFERTGLQWKDTQKIGPSDAKDGDGFGYSVDLEGDVCVVGAPWKNGLGTPDSGAAYVFRNVGGTWTEEAKLEAFDFKQNDRFGWEVGVSGPWIVVSAPYDDDVGIDSGSLYVYEHVGGSWVHRAKLTSTLGASTSLGWSLAIEDDVIAASSTSLERVAIFRRSAGVWAESASVTGPDTVLGDYFGSCLDLDGSRMVVGSPSDDDAGDSSGSVYVFRRAGPSFALEMKLVPSGARIGEGYPRTVAVSGSLIAGTIGAPVDEVRSAYFSDVAGPGGCLGTSLAEIATSAGNEQRMEFHGPVSFAGDAYFVLGSVTGAAPGVVIDGVQVPLNLDFYTNLTLAYANTPPFHGFAGTVDAFGGASPRFKIPAGGLPPAAAGLKLHHAVVVVENGCVVAASEAAPLELK